MKRSRSADLHGSGGVDGLSLIALVVLAVALVGCTTPSTKSQKVTRTGDPLVDGRAAIAQGPEKDRVLWQYRTALAAMHQGQYDEAKATLDDALNRIEPISAGDKSAKRARNYFYRESEKFFRGEPYERVMANYYRGILYWRDGDLGNARACFRNGQFQDGDSENKDYAGDYVLLDYLDGAASFKLGGDGSDALKHAQQSFKNGTLPAYSANANTLFFVEFGPGPVKYATGNYGEQLRIRTVDSPVRSARIHLGSQAIVLIPFDDLNFQATTRGGRVMDHILGNKAVFKTTTDVVGTAAILAGAVVATDSKHEETGLALVAAGLLSKVIASATTPAADTRSWKNLPQFLTFAAVELPPGLHTATVEFLDAAGQTVSRLTKTVSVNVAAPPRDTVVYVSDQSRTSQPL